MPVYHTFPSCFLAEPLQAACVAWPAQAPVPGCPVQHPRNALSRVRSAAGPFCGGVLLWGGAHLFADACHYLVMLFVTFKLCCT